MPSGIMSPQSAAQQQTLAITTDGTAESREMPTSFASNGLRPRSESVKSVPPPGSILTGKQEHYLKRELIAQQTKFEITELASTTALQRFGAPFRSDAGEVAPEDSELPLLRYIFVNHVRNFPFLDQAREKEFWQDKLQVFLESFAQKHISSSEDRLEETKRRKLAIKAEKVVELMMVSGLPTASGYEERIRFSEIEVIDRGANEQGLVVNMPEGRKINGWDVNIAGVRTTLVKRTVRYHKHAEFILKVHRQGEEPVFVGRRYGQFAKLHKLLRLEFPGKILPRLPRKNKKHTGAFFGGGGGDGSDDDASSVSSQSERSQAGESPGGLRAHFGLGNGHSRSTSSLSGASTASARRASADSWSRASSHFVLYREEQRVSLRAFLRTLLQSQPIAKSSAMRDFLIGNPVTLNREETEDLARRKEMDERRIEEQRKFYEVARKRAKELDVHMEKFRRDIVESNGLTKLFREIRQKDRIADLSPEYQKFAEWLRIEVAATIYHVFLAEDNSPELYAQGKRIHSLVPYTALKNVIRFANPAAVMKGVLDLFLAQPLGARSLMQRIFGMAINDGIRSTQKFIDSLYNKIDDPVFCEKIKQYVYADEDLKETVRAEAADEQNDLIVVILRSELIDPELDAEQIGRVFNAWVAWNSAVENVDQEMVQGAEMFARLKQLLKLLTRQRDKQMMLSIIEEPVTLQLFRDLFTIFYEPLVRVYKSANVYSSVTDFASFADDIVRVVDAAQRQDVSADPNQTVQSFIDLCQRHEDDFYKFVHEVHIHDNGLFDQLMTWLEGILDFLRKGPRGGGKLDMNALIQGAVDLGQVDKTKSIAEIDALIAWQMERKRWHNDKTRRKMAAAGAEDVTGTSETGAGADATFENGAAAVSTTTTTKGASAMTGGFRSSDFGLNQLDIQDLGLGEDDASDDDDDEDGAAYGLDDEDAGIDADPIEAERRRRIRVQEVLRSKRGEPAKPNVQELKKLREGFVGLVRGVLSN